MASNEPETVAEHLFDLVHLFLGHGRRGEEVAAHLADILRHLTDICKGQILFFVIMYNWILLFILQ